MTVFVCFLQGCEDKFEKFILQILNSNFYGSLVLRYEEYKDMLDYNADVLLRGYKYSRRVEPQNPFVLMVRAVFGDSITYESVSWNLFS